MLGGVTRETYETCNKCRFPYSWSAALQKALLL